MTTKLAKVTPPKPRKKGGQVANANAARHLFYSDKFTEDELSRIAGYTSDPTPDDEIFMLRVLNRRVLEYAKDKDGSVLAGLVEILSTSSGRIGSLLRLRRNIMGETGDSISDALATIINELGAEWGVELT